MKKVEPRTLSGFMELLPSNQLKFNKILSIIKDTYEQFAFLPIDTPIIEASEVLLAKAGGETEKQIYRIQRGDSDLTLRFDLTVPLAKYVAKNYGSLSFPFRRYQIGKVYRGERAQKGRFREFYQCDIDIVGDGELSIVNDAEIPNVIFNVFNKLNVGDFIIKINNRKIMNGFLEAYGVSDYKVEILRIIDKFDKIGLENVKIELQKVVTDKTIVDRILSFISLDGSNEVILESLKALNIENELFSKGVEELEVVYNYSKLFGIKDDNLKIDMHLSRGFDYYTGTVYETVLKDYPELGSVCGGGRYDNLAEFYTDHQLPGVGISIGLTRLYDKLMELNLLKEEQIRTSDILIIPMTDNYEYIIKCYNTLNSNKFRAQIFSEKRSIKSIINYALSNSIPYVMFIGDDEINKNVVTIKNIATHDQQTDTIEKVMEVLNND